MRPSVLLAAAALVLTWGPVDGPASQDTNTPGVRLEALTWMEAEPRLTARSVVVLPLGAAALEHGPHLELRNDLTLADYLARRVMAATDVVVAPPVTYHYYPAFLEYPGSTSLSAGTARDVIADIVRSLARHGPRRFYVLNTAVSTVGPLESAARVVAPEGIALRYTNLEARLDQAVRTVREQAGGWHADEIETSMMLYVDPASVDMRKAANDYRPGSAAPTLTRQRGGRGTYSPTGIWGDATRATREKGQVLVEALVGGILNDIETLRRAAPPPASPASVERAPVPRAPTPESRTQGNCTQGDDRRIRTIGPRFSMAWKNQDALALSLLWTEEGDILHPDQTSERSREIIRQNRAMLFTRPEFRFSQHFLTIGHVRCASDDVAVADGKWELRNVVDAKRQPVPTMTGLLTLVLKRAGGAWSIEAYRYTMDPLPAGSSAPIVRPRPGGPPAPGR